MRPARRPASSQPDASSQAAPITVIRLPSRSRGFSPAALLWMALGAGLLGVLCLAAAALAGEYAYYQVSGAILRGVHLGPVQLGGLTVSQAAALLEQNWRSEARIQATNGLQSVELTPAQLGISLDARRTAQRAHEIGHGGSLPEEFARLLASLVTSQEVEPVIFLDEAQARAGLEAIAPQLGKPARDATLRLEGTAIVPVPGELGYTINVEATLAELKAEPGAVLQRQRLEVVPQPAPPRVTDVAPAMAQAQRLLDTPLAIQGYDPLTDEQLSWPVPRQSVGAWLKVEAGEHGPQIALDEAQVAAYLSELSAGLGQGRFIDPERYAAPLAQALRQGQALPVVLSHRPTTYTVQPGDTLLKIGWKVGMPYWMIARANPGVNPEAISTGEELAIPSKDDLLPLPVIPGKRIVIDLSQQRLKVFQDGQSLGNHVISTGIDRSPTQPGVFQVQSHDRNAYASVWDLYMPDFLGIYEAWPGFMNGIHGLPTLSNGQRLWANVLGRPASYGCIILDLQTAHWLYDWAENGVVVEIRE